MQSNIYVLGGYAGAAACGGYLSHCEKYCVLKNEWTIICSMSERKEGVSACIFDNQFIYAIGGIVGGYLDTIEKYCIQNNQWETV